MYELNTRDIKAAQEGSEEALARLIKENTGLIFSIINRFLGRGYEKEELYQIGCIGLIKSIKRFDFKYNVRFSTYAVPYIMGEIKKFIRDDNPIKISRNLKELSIKIKEIEMEHFNKNGEEISIKEISKQLGISKEEIAAAIESTQPVESIYGEAYREDKDGETKISRINNNQEDINKLINSLAMHKLIEELNNREKYIIYLRYFEDKTQNDVAKILGVSQVQISRIEKKILLSMREKMVG